MLFPDDAVDTVQPRDIAAWLKRSGGKDDVVTDKDTLQATLDSVCVVCIEGHGRFRVISSRFHHILCKGTVPHMVRGNKHFLFWKKSPVCSELMYRFSSNTKYAGMSLLVDCNVWLSTSYKDWRVRMSYDNAVYIPDELLDMCSVPGMYLDVEVGADCGMEAKRAVKWTAITRNMGFLREDEIKGDKNLPSGYSFVHFDEAVNVLTTGFITRATANTKFYKRVYDFLDSDCKWLGCPVALQLAKVHLDQMMCLAANEPDWLFSAVQDRTLLFHDVELGTINITHGTNGMSGKMLSPPVSMEPWRFHNKVSPPMFLTKMLSGDGREEQEEPNLNVFKTPSNCNLGRLVEDSMPWYLRVLLQENAGRMVLAGGKVVGQILKHTGKGQDFDVFCCVLKREELRATVTNAISRLRAISKIGSIHVTSNAITVVTMDNIKIQFIVRNMFADVNDIVHSFDLPACQAAFYYMPITSGKEVRCFSKALRVTPAFIDCAKRHAFWLDLTVQHECMLARAMKYFFKGFEVYVPGTTWFRVYDTVPEIVSIDAKTQILDLIQRTNWLQRHIKPEFVEMVKVLKSWEKLLDDLRDQPHHISMLLCQSIVHSSWRWTAS